MTTDVHALLGGYVADALSPREQAEFERHLTTCQNCRDEVREFRETTAELSALVATPPPPELREQLLATIATTRPEPPEPQPAGHRPGTRLRRLFALAAVLLVVVGSGSIAVAARLQTDRIQQAVQADTSVLAAPDVRFATAELPDGGTVTYAISASRQQGLVVSTALPPLTDGRTYQLWTMPTLDPAQARANVTFAGGQVRQIFDAPADTKALAITIEASGGAQHPNAETMRAPGQI